MKVLAIFRQNDSIPMASQIEAMSPQTLRESPTNLFIVLESLRQLTLLNGSSAPACLFKRDSVWCESPRDSQEDASREQEHDEYAPAPETEIQIQKTKNSVSRGSNLTTVQEFA